MKTFRALRFLFVGPMVFIGLFVINWMTSPGDWWVQWAALGIGIAWVISLFRVIFAAIVAGGGRPAGHTSRAPLTRTPPSRQHTRKGVRSLADKGDLDAHCHSL